MRSLREMAVTTNDHWIATEQGRLFARVWVPSDLRRDRDAPLLLFHDSLGCVELWRDFPEQLAVATRRRVVAYDRLGFGRSNPYPGALPLTFIRDEGATAVPRLLEALGVNEIIAFGHSVGGGMAIATAARWRRAAWTWRAIRGIAGAARPAAHFTRRVWRGRASAR